MKIKYILPFVLFLILVLIVLPNQVFAFCPVCTVAVGAGVGFSRWLKIDDVITGLWIGAFILSSALWTINWLKNKKWTFTGDRFVVFIVFYASIIIPLHYTNILGHPFNKIFGLDKLIFGLIIGSIVFLFSIMLYEYLKKINKGKSYFKFQKIATPIVLLLIASGIFYFITKGK